MKYFPLNTDQFEHQFGVRAIRQNESIVEATPLYQAEIALKRQQLEENAGGYFAALPESLASQRQAVKFIIEQAGFLTASQNLISGENLAIEDSTPLLSIASHVQEDLVIMSGDQTRGFPMVAGCVCFPSGWSIQEKIGQSVLSIHQPVPDYAAELDPATQRLMNAIRPGRPVWRMNWGIRPSSQLDQSPVQGPAIVEAAKRVNQENAGQRCFFRVERQTLARIPDSNDVLFAIHTHQCKLDQLADREVSNLLGVLQTCPPETLSYKGIAPMKHAIESFLRSRLPGT
jgi:hypothetical protein